MSSAEKIRAELITAAQELGADASVDPVIERPRDPSLGDWTTNLAMTLARPLKKRPAEIAGLLRDRMRLAEAGVEKVDIAGPGFMNFWLDPARIVEAVREVIAADEDFGKSDAGHGQPVNIEFVSANPTGPLHVGHGRQAALGDAIATLLEWTGWKVSREFYYNDAGVQIENLGASVRAWLDSFRGGDLSIPEGGYHGEYIREIAERYAREHDGKIDEDDVRSFAVAALRGEQDLDLQAFGVKFDKYFLESSLYTDGRVEQTVEALGCDESDRGVPR